MVNAQQWLDKEYPKEKRTEIKKLDINNHFNQNQLEGHLDLSDFINLEELHCYGNKLTSLNLKGLKNLQILDAGYNELTNLDDITSSLSPNNLRILKLHDNNFSEDNLSKLAKFVNLKTLYLANYLNSNDHINRPIKKSDDCYNRFYGSLEFLKDMNELEDLSIPNTNIDSGLEYLSSGVKTFRCMATREIFEVKKISELLGSEPEAWGIVKIFPQKLKEYKENLFKERKYLINQIIKKDEEIEGLASELLEIKKNELNQLLNEVKNKLDKSLWAYLDILLLSPDKSLISEKAKENLTDKINGNDLQKLLLLQHQINHLERKISEVSQQTQIEVLPPSYN